MKALKIRLIPSNFSSDIDSAFITVLIKDHKIALASTILWSTSKSAPYSLFLTLFYLIKRKWSHLELWKYILILAIQYSNLNSIFECTFYNKMCSIVLMIQGSAIGNSICCCFSATDVCLKNEQTFFSYWAALHVVHLHFAFGPEQKCCVCLLLVQQYRVGLWVNFIVILSLSILKFRALVLSE